MIGFALQILTQQRRRSRNELETIETLAVVEMFALFAGLWEYLFSKAELHLLIVGLDDAGKTVRYVRCCSCFCRLLV